MLRLAREALGLRREFEALVLSGRALVAADAAGDPEGGFAARLHRAAALLLLRDGARASGLLDDLTRRIGSLRPARRARWTRLLLALGAEVRAVMAGDGTVPGFEGATIDAAGGARALRARVAALGLAARRGERDALETSSALLSELATAPGADVGPAARGELALLVADAANRLADAAAIVRRAHDVAAAAAFDRLAELERFVLEVPEVATPSFEDAEALEARRLRASAGHDAFHAAVARRLASPPSEGPAAGPLAAEGELTCVCSWCQRVRTRKGAWLSIQHFLPLELEGPIPLTHGICDACEPSLRRQLDHAAVGMGV